MSGAHVILILEGTYPYVSGGVSSWVHQLLLAFPQRTFSLVHIGPEPNWYKHQLFELPTNVLALQEVHCRGAKRARTIRSDSRFALQTKRRKKIKSMPRVLAALRDIHLEDQVDDRLVGDLCAGDLSVREFLHGDASFALLQQELYPRIGQDSSFTDFFWHFRALHIPLLRLLNSSIEDGQVYHAVSAGYAGLLGVAASIRTGRPFVITEHGIYARERQIEIARASWIRDEVPHTDMSVQPSPLRNFWCHFFKMLSRIAYHQATRVITLSETNRGHQVTDGADPTKTDVVPNGVDHQRFQNHEHARNENHIFRAGFVGRVVPIKDVVTLLKAFQLARETASMELWIIGPEDEDPQYVKRCRALADGMGLTDEIVFLGPQPVAKIYPKLDVLILTSISEGQPLVILEAFANALPVIATDVGACRELIEGHSAEDRALGVAGVVTRVASPIESAAALSLLATDAAGRRAMGQTGLARVLAYYQQEQVIVQYDKLYNAMVSS